MSISALLRDSDVVNPDDVKVDVDFGAEAVSDVELPDEPVIQPDPKPAHRTRRGRTKAAPMAAPTSKADKAALEQKIRDNLSMMIGMPAATWAMRDPHCGGTLFAQSDAIIDALVPIIMRNPSMLKWFTSAGGGFMDYLTLATAIWPVGKTVYSHHVKKVDPSNAGSGVNLDLSGFAAPGFA